MNRHARLLVVLAFALCVPWAGPATGQGPAIDGAVFQIVTVTGTDAHLVESGTAFFIRPDGMALTNSHVVYQAWRDQARFRLMALIGKEFYSAEVLCADTLQYDPTDASANVVLGRDIATIKVSASRFTFTRWGPKDSLYVAHLRPNPPFPWLEFGHDAAPGEPIRVVGYGFIPVSGSFGQRWTTAGTVSEVRIAMDGTAVFRVSSINRPRPGNSGSPVLDAQDHVVGMWTWNEAESLAFGQAISSSALSQGCR